MNNFSKIAVILLGGIIFCFSFCKKKDKYPVVPEITFVGFEKFGADSARVVISFTDGDGDIGLTESDSIAPYQFNFFAKYYQKRNGVFVEKVLSPPLNYRIPTLNSSKKTKSLEGEIWIILPGPYYILTIPKDTIQYEFYIKDRALNESNHVFSNEIIIP